MNVGIVGLGLIGGSFAKALAGKSEYAVFAYDIDKTILHYAVLTGDVKGELTDGMLGECDFLILSLYPTATVEYLREKAALIKKGTIVIDTAGTKRSVCEAGFSLADEHGFVFVGGHPMAGTQFSGFKHARATLYSGATMVVTPRKNEDLHVLDKVKSLMLDCGFAKLNVTTPETHDELIAFTSQLAHVVSNAYVKSPSALRHKNFSAGSYKDLTRVARLNETMWTDLFLDNRDNLLTELDIIIDNLQKYRDALEERDADELRSLLREGRIIKERTLYGEKDQSKNVT